MTGIQHANLPFDRAGFGVCVIDLKEGLLFQNPSCRDICQCKLEHVCPFSEGGPQCQLGKLTSSLDDSSLHVLRAVEIGAQFYDIVFIRETDREYRLIFPLDVKIQSLSRTVKGHGLTPRELEIASLIIVGLTNEQLCERLGVTRNTLRAHVKNLNRKLPEKAKRLLGRQIAATS